MYVYVAVTRLANLDSESILFDDVSKIYTREIKQGERGNGVRAIQYYLSVIGTFNNAVIPTTIDGIFGPSTTKSVKSFQRAYNLKETGIIDENTWNALLDAYKVVLDSIPDNTDIKPFPGEDLKYGTQTSSVKLIQQYLNKIADAYPSIPKVEETGYFGPKTQSSVIAYQEEFNIPVSGVVGAVTWNSIMQTYASL